MNILNISINQKPVKIGFKQNNLSNGLKQNKNSDIIDTLVETIIGAIPKLGGEYKTGLRVDIGYFHQQMAEYTSDKQVIDDYHDEFPTLTHTEVRSDLGAFLFSGDEVFKKVSMLSGGERVRLALCKILKRRPNFLVLDEPTNHMDIVGKETLEKMLKDYEGTILFVSHDRYFIKQISNKLLSFENGYSEFFAFGYEDYLAKKAAEAEKEKEQSAIATKVKETKTYDNPGKERSKLQRKVAKIEETIEEYEKNIANKKEELLNPEYASMYTKLSEIQEEIDELEEKLMEVMEEWETVTKELEAL